MVHWLGYSQTEPRPTLFDLFCWPTLQNCHPEWPQRCEKHPKNIKIAFTHWHPSLRSNQPQTDSKNAAIFWSTSSEAASAANSPIALGRSTGFPTLGSWKNWPSKCTMWWGAIPFESHKSFKLDKSPNHMETWATSCLPTPWRLEHPSDPVRSFVVPLAHSCHTPDKQKYTSSSCRLMMENYLKPVRLRGRWRLSDLQVSQAKRSSWTCFNKLQPRQRLPAPIPVHQRPQVCHTSLHMREIFLDVLGQLRQFLTTALI